MSFNKTGTIPTTSTAPAKKGVPSFLQKKKDVTQATVNQTTLPQTQSTLQSNQYQSPQATVQKTNQTQKQRSLAPPTVKEIIPAIEKELFPSLQRVREKDPRQLEVNLQKCKEVYDFYERKGRNEMPVKELGNALRSLGYLVSTREVRELQEKLQKQVKSNNIVISSFIEFKDFLVAVHLVQSKLPNERELQGALQIFDKTNTGSINKDMLKGVLTKIGDIIPEKEFDNLFSTLYTDQNGNIPMQYIVGTLLKYPQP